MPYPFATFYSVTLDDDERTPVGDPEAMLEHDEAHRLANEVGDDAVVWAYGRYPEATRNVRWRVPREALCGDCRTWTRADCLVDAGDAKPELVCPACDDARDAEAHGGYCRPVYPVPVANTNDDREPDWVRDGGST